MIEKILNVFVGLLLFNNLYYLGFYVKLDYQLVLMLSAIVSFLFFTKSLILNRDSLKYIFFKSTTSHIVLVITIFSILFYYINPHETKDIDANDLIRVIILFFYFMWTGLKYGSPIQLKKYLITISAISLFVSFFLALFEYNLPSVFGLMFKEENIFDEDTWIRRVGGTLRDANTFSCAIIIYAFFLYFYFFKKNQKAFLLITHLLVFYLVNLSGSRQGILLFVVYSGYIFFDLKLSSKSKFFIIISIIIVSVGIGIKSLADKNEMDTVFARVLKENDKADASKADRWQSIVNGVDFTLNNYYGLYGPGSILFMKFWKKKFKDEAEVAPHNLFIFLFAQFGIFSLIIYWCLYTFTIKALKKNLKFVPVMFLIIVFLLSNIIYYGITLLLVWFIDNYKLIPNREMKLKKQAGVIAI